MRSLCLVGLMQKSKQKIRRGEQGLKLKLDKFCINFFRTIRATAQLYLSQRSLMVFFRHVECSNAADYKIDLIC
jgi:hypothetical protein